MTQLTALPTPPSLGDSQTAFDAKATAWLAAVQNMVTEINAGYVDQPFSASTTSNSIAIGSKTFTVLANRNFQVGMWVIMADSAAPTVNLMLGQVTSYSSTTLIVDVQFVMGSGTKTSWNIYQSATTANIMSPSSLTNYISPSVDAGWRDVYRSGWLPNWFNQQWGGAQWGGLPDGRNGDIATGNVEDNQSRSLASAASDYYDAQGFKVSESATYDAVWVKLYKLGNPTYNLTARVWSDAAGAPSAAIGSAATISAKLITSKTDGEWYLITGLAAALTAGTQYHIVLTSLAAADATNYICWKLSYGTRKYPHGSINQGTSAPVWAPTTADGFCFLIPNPSANKFLQSGGQFDGKIKFLEGAPLNQSKALCQPMKNFFDGTSFTMLHRFKNLPVSKTIADFMFGLDHERLVIYTDASGYVNLRFYDEAGVANNITTTAVVTGASLVDIAVKGLFSGAARGAAGTDSLYLYVNGVSVGTPLTNKTWEMSNDWRDLGTATIGGGFPVAPTWTQDMQMGSLPSAQGWTWTGTATEASAMSVAGGKLYQNANGYTSTQSGYYAKTVALNNATGWAVQAKVRAASDLNATYAGGSSISLEIQDGAKLFNLNISEYFAQSTTGSVVDATIQGDFKSVERVWVVCGKGSDYYVFLDGKLVIDGTGKLVTASATNAIYIGDTNTTASQNSDAVWNYVKYYQGAFLPQAATGGELHESAFWSGDKSALLPYAYNSGVPVSIKQLCGVGKNYVGEGVVQKEMRRGVTTNPTNTTAAWSLLMDMECFSIGSSFRNEVCGGYMYNTTLGSYTQLTTTIDGVNGITAIGLSSTANAYCNINSLSDTNVPLGLHKLEGKWWAPTATGYAAGTNRTQTVNARS